MKFISYIYDGKENYGVLDENDTKVIPMELLLEKINKEIPKNLQEFIRIYSNTIIPDLESALNESNNNGISLDDVKITAPIPYPRRNVFCLGKNYADHAMEVKSIPGGKADIPDYPIYFTKVTDPAIGHMDKVTISKEYTEKIDYEVELAVIIGKDGKNISPEEVKIIYLDIPLEMTYPQGIFKLNMYSGLREKA